MSEEIELQYINCRAPTAERSTVHSGRRLKVTVLRVAVVLAVALIVAFVTDGIALFLNYTQTKKTITIAATPVPTCPNSVAPCGDDWVLNGTKCYYFSPRSVKLPWNESRAMCQWLYGDLVKIESREEQEFLMAKLQVLGPLDMFWIGLTDSESEGRWVWTDGSALNTSLTFWADDFYNKEPDNWTNDDLEGEDCVRVSRKLNLGDLGNWYDRSCKKKERSICEKTARIF